MIIQVPPLANVAEFERALRNAVPPPFEHLLVGPVHAALNGFLWFALLPDGSKEWWAASDAGDQVRGSLHAIVRAWKGTAVEVKFGELGTEAWTSDDRVSD